MNVSFILAGFGNVGRALARLVGERHDLLRKQYDIDLVCHGIVASK